MKDKIVLISLSVKNPQKVSNKCMKVSLKVNSYKSQDRPQTPTNSGSNSKIANI